MVGMRGAQPLSYNLRLPDAAQDDALRLLDASQAVINKALTALWPHLDAYATARSGPDWKQVDALLSSPAPHGSGQWRYKAEVVGRLLRAQAERKHTFERVLPLMSAGFIRPKTETWPAGKERTAIAGASDRGVGVGDLRRQLTSEAAWYGGQVLVARRRKPSTTACSGSGWGDSPRASSHGP
jgi:hypothetical protein